MSIFLEYIIVLILVFIFFYITTIRKKQKYDKNNLPVELLYLKNIYKITISKENYKNFIYTYSLINTFIISTDYIILMYLLDNWILRIIIGIILLILMIIICYGLLARYYLKKEGR